MSYRWNLNDERKPCLQWCWIIYLFFNHHLQDLVLLIASLPRRRLKYSFSVVQFKKLNKMHAKTRCLTCIQKQWQSISKQSCHLNPSQDNSKKKTFKISRRQISHKISRWQTGLSHDTIPISVTHAKRIKFLQWSFDKTVFALLSTSRY